MQDFKIDGIGTISGGEYGNLTIDGVGKCNEDLKAESIHADGTFSCKGTLTVGTFDCDGMTSIDGNIQAKKISVDGMLNVKGGTKIEASEIFCDGLIHLNGQMSADRIDADGSIDAREIVGDRIRILSHHRGFMAFQRRSRIELIEATEVELCGVVARTVNGKNVTIGRGCRIENVDCSGSLYISPWASVAHVTGNYVKREK